MYWPRDWSLEYSTSDWPPIGLLVADKNHSRLAVWAVYSPYHYPVTYPVLHQFAKEAVMRDSAQSLTKVEISSIYCSALIHQASNSLYQASFSP